MTVVAGAHGSANGTRFCSELPTVLLAEAIAMAAELFEQQMMSKADDWLANEPSLKQAPLSYTNECVLFGCCSNRSSIPSHAVGSVKATPSQQDHANSYYRRVLS